MSNYFDKWGRLHDRPVTKDKPVPSNNGWIYSAYFHKAGGKLNLAMLRLCFINCIVTDVETKRIHLIRSPKNAVPPISRDEILGLAELGLLEKRHLNGWNFSPYPLPRFNPIKLVEQLIEAYGQHRNYFWKNNLDQIFQFAFSIPLQDRAFILECFGEKRSIRYFFYKAIAFIDSKLSTPKNGIHWLKYGGEDRKKIMQQEFPEQHPLRSI